MRSIVLACAVAAILSSASQAAQITWDERFWDPAGGADLILPLPCGAAMAFQRIDTPVPGGDRTSDRAVQLGLAGTGAGWIDYLRRAFIRGGFSDPADGMAHYYIGRYELTRDQLAALDGDCSRPTMRGRVPASGLSWFDAVDAARGMTEWLRQEAPGALPGEEGVPGYLRLPTEEEWEYAVRGGANVEESVFNQRTFPIEGAMRDYAWHQGAESARGTLRPVGLLAGNPAGLHDVYGGVEELMLEPFHMNALGRFHGQPGGVVTRGGSILSRAAELSSGARQEFPAYGPSDGKPVALDTFGARFVIGIHLAVSTGRSNALSAAWFDRFARGGGADADESLTDLLDSLIADELEYAKRTRLEAARLKATEEIRERAANRLKTLKALIMGGAVLVQFLREDKNQVALATNAIEAFDKAIEEAEDGRGIIDASELERLIRRREKLQAGLDNDRKRFALNFVSYERNMVTTATEYEAGELDEALDVLVQELELSGRSGLVPLARDFQSDIAAYAANPAMTTPGILRLVLE